jgi:hypothetical protein
LLLSSYVVYTARRINNFIFFSKRLPQLQKKIKEHASAISNLLNNFKDSYEDICAEMTRCSANLKALNRGIPRNQRKKINKLSNFITSKLTENSITEKDVRYVYLELLYINEDNMNIKMDFEMEK